jgi:peptidoglycan/xylan/chitin deacetylase (PgdA/CDA1 family)
MIKINTYIFTLFLLVSTSYASEKEICITIDDLPFVGRGSSLNDINRGRDRFNKMLDALIEAKVPATGFVIAGAIAKGQWQLLEKFKNQGFVIGNHTFTHANLNQMGADKYIKEISKAHDKLSSLISEKKYFRYPYLAEGRGATKHKVQAYLANQQYIIAPVTIDSKDFRFNMQLLAYNRRVRDNYVEQIKQRYLSYIWKQTEKAEKLAHGRPVKQILLIHSNLLNSHAIADVIQLYKDHGYRFITLDEALKPNEPTPQMVESYLFESLNSFANLHTLTDNFLT